MNDDEYRRKEAFQIITLKEEARASLEKLEHVKLLDCATSLAAITEFLLKKIRQSDAGDIVFGSPLKAHGALAELLKPELVLAFSSGEKQQKTTQAKNGARAKLANDPKQAAKTLVREHWDAWQRKPDNYKNKTAFAKVMMDKYESLDNQNVIVRWCGAWEKENSTQLVE